MQPAKGTAASGGAAGRRRARAQRPAAAFAEVCWSGFFVVPRGEFKECSKFLLVAEITVLVPLEGFKIESEP